MLEWTGCIWDGPQNLPVSYVLQEDPEDIPLPRREEPGGPYEQLDGHPPKAGVSRRYDRTRLPDSNGLMGVPKQ